MQTGSAQKFLLKPFQFDYVYSQDRYPAFISAWGTGKSLCLILRAMLYAEQIPNNLIYILRREWVDLKDSTIKDFESYTGLTVGSDRNVKFHNGSVIMFRHIEELNKAGKNLQNINLGAFFIEQVEELPTDREFFILQGRLRRKVAPSDYFKKLGLSDHTGSVVGNVAGDNWVKKLWKDAPTAQYELIEAITYDNADVLPKDFIDNLESLKTKKPEIYKRFVMNDWTAEVEGRVFKNIENCIAGGYEEPQAGIDYIMGVDLAKSLDYTVITVMNRRNKHLDYFKRLESDNRTSWFEQKEHIKQIAEKYNNALCVVDASGPGDPIVEDLQRAGVGVWHHQKPSGDSVPGVKFTNIIKEDIVEKLKVAIENRLITFPKIDVLIDELNDFECQMTATRKYRYQAPEGKHDDCVISLGLAVWALLGGMYDIYTEPKPVTKADEFWQRIRKDTDRYNEMHRTEEAQREIAEEDCRAV